MVTAVKDGSDGVVSVIRGFGAGNEGKSAVKTLGKKQLFGVNCICKWLDTQILDSQVYYLDGEPSKGLVMARLASKLFF